ncbi:DUF1800 domain-containing protein [Mesobacterium pallidum]|uniref:DUF1800 domain-containing protein n=1 Tax=Mesobacterium pallidum TaxID=2872037 RepID=UPI001EE25771
MRFDPQLAEFRFGYGLSPDVAPPASVDAMMTRLTGPDRMAQRFPIEGFDQFRIQLMGAAQDLRDRRRKERTPEANTALIEGMKELRKTARMGKIEAMGRHLARRSRTDDALRERLVAFWADHFTARGKAGVEKFASSAHVESTIRPHVAGRFEDMLIASTTSPLMITYLDQQQSVGPNSPRALKTPKDDGLNENLAREVMELHTLGVGGPYTQDDVRQLAELLTGLTFEIRNGTKFRKDYAEPGAETVLGRSYGGTDDPNLRDIHAALRDLARHPATARHIAHKLAVHFVADAPDQDLVDRLAARFEETGGDLAAVTRALLEHPASWAAPMGNIRPPFAYVSTVVRALAPDPARLHPDGAKPFIRQLEANLSRMGQPYEEPNGPDGWPESDAAWLTPQGIAARLQWALIAPRQLLGDDLPDPRDFVLKTLGPRADERLKFAAGAAESRRDGLGVILASPAFQRS